MWNGTQWEYLMGWDCERVRAHVCIRALWHEAGVRLRTEQSLWPTSLFFFFVAARQKGNNHQQHKRAAPHLWRRQSAEKYIKYKKKNIKKTAATQRAAVYFWRTFLFFQACFCHYHSWSRSCLKSAGRRTAQRCAQSGTCTARWGKQAASSCQRRRKRGERTDGRTDGRRGCSDLDPNSVWLVFISTSRCRTVSRFSLSRPWSVCGTVFMSRAALVTNPGELRPFAARKLFGAWDYLEPGEIVLGTEVPKVAKLQIFFSWQTKSDDPNYFWITLASRRPEF